MSRSRRVIAGVAANYLSFTINAAIRLVATPFYLARLGGELLGFNSFIQETVAYFQLMQLGIGPGAAAIVAKELQPDASEQQRDDVRKKLRAGGQLQQVLAAAAVLLAFGLAILIEGIAEGLPPEFLFMAQVCTVAYGLKFALLLSSNVFAGILVGNQLIAQNTLYFIGMKVLSTGVAVLLVALGWSLYGLATAAVGSGLVLLILLRWRTQRLGISLKIYQGPIEWQSMKEIVPLSFWIMLATFGGLLSWQSSRIILGVTPGLGMTVVNKFSLLVTAPFILRSQAHRIAALTRPGLTQIAHSKDIDRARNVGLLLLRIMGLIATIAFVGIWYLNGSFVVKWVGPEYFVGHRANLLVAMLCGITIWLFAFKTLLEVRFQFRRRCLVFIAAGLSTVGLSIVLAPTWGIEGVLFAVLISEVLFVVPLGVFPILSWLASGRSLAATVLSLLSVPLLLLAIACVISMLELPRPVTWLGMVLEGAGILAVGAAAGIAWFGKELLRYRPSLTLK